MDYTLGYGSDTEPNMTETRARENPPLSEFQIIMQNMEQMKLDARKCIETRSARSESKERKSFLFADMEK